MTDKRLLKSWATPPARLPMASIFCDWRSCSSLRRSASVRALALDRMPDHALHQLRRDLILGQIVGRAGLHRLDVDLVIARPVSKIIGPR